MSRWSVVRFVGGLAFACCLLGGELVARAQVVNAWPHDPNYLAELNSYISDVFPSGEPHPLLQIVRTINVEGFSSTVAATSQVMSFGPFRARNDQALNGVEPGPGLPGNGAGQAETFAVAIMARSPQSPNFTPALTEIGREEFTLQAGQEKTFTITVNMPGALSAVDIRAEVADSVIPIPDPIPADFTQGTFQISKSISPDCAVADASCLQVGIDPLGIELALAPVTILYEPPGNCSSASFSANALQGTSLAFDQANAVGNGTLTTIPDPSGSSTTSSVTATKTDDTSKSIQVQVALGATFFTQESTTNCNQPPTSCSSRTTGGPGHGDVFVLLDNAPIVYWNTGNLSNARFAGEGEPIPPGQLPSAHISFTADDVKNIPAQLPGTMAVRTQADRNAVLSLDPLVALAQASSGGAATTAPVLSLPLPRYVPLNLGVGPGPNESQQIVESVTDTQATTGVIKTAIDQVNSSMTAANGATTVLEKIDLDAIGSNGIAGSAAKKLAASGNPAFGFIGSEIDSLLGTLTAQPTTKTTMQTTLTNSTTVGSANIGGSVQNACFRDSTRSLNVQLYWDQLFGTFAYQEIPAAMGTLALDVQAAAAAVMKPLANVGWVKTIITAESTVASFPQSIAEQLSAVAGGGSFTLQPVPSGSFQVHSGFLAGVPNGVSIGVAGLTGTTSADPGVYQQAFFIVDPAGNNDGVFWQTIAVAASNASANAMCSSEPNDAAPGTEIVTCCSLAGICDSFVASGAGLKIHLEAENNSASSGTTASATAVTGNADGAYIEFAGVDLGPLDGLIASFTGRALPSAAGQTVTLWVDGPTAAGGGTELAPLAFDATSQNCTGSWADQHQTRTTVVNGAPSGTHNIFVVYNGPPGDSLDWIELSFEAISPVGPRVQYRVGDVGQPHDNQIQPWVSVANDGTTDMTLKNLVLRYWYTIDSGAPQALNVDYAPFGSQNVAGTFEAQLAPKQGADYALAVSFPNATCFVPPAGSTGEIHLRVNKTDWSNYDETNDYSYDATKTTFADSSVITAYVNGTLMWGNEPAAIPGSETASSGTNFHVQYRVGDPGQPTDNAIKAQFNIVNDNTVSVPLQQLKLRYWFTGESTVADQFWCDYARLGNSNVTGTVIKLATPRPSADRYIEVSFTQGAGALFPLGSTGEVQTRVSPVDWSNYNELNDYSYNPNDMVYVNSSQVTLYRNGTLVWGTEP